MCSPKLRLYASKVLKEWRTWNMTHIMSPDGWHMSWELKHKYKSTRGREGRVFQTNRPTGTEVYWRKGSRWVRETGETQKGSESGAQKTRNEIVEEETTLSRALHRSQEAHGSVLHWWTLMNGLQVVKGKTIWIPQWNSAAAWRMTGGVVREGRGRE